MRTSSTVISPTIVRRSADPVSLPPLAAWVEDLFTGAQARELSGASAQSIVLRERPGFLLISVCIPRATAMNVSELEAETYGAYKSIGRELDTRRLHAVRFWNHIPQINQRMDDGRDRYMVFNAGRYRAFCSWYGGPSEFDRQIATASGIGHLGRDLLVHCLAMEQSGSAIENPRQVAPYHYSKRFGPLPPAFARATVLKATEDLPGRILVGGTASVRGEDSVYFGDLSQQLDETFVNLGALVSAARPGSNGVALSHYRELRAYVPQEANFDGVITAIAQKFPTLQRLEVLRADLCRPELLVEIEGIAD